MASLQNLSFEVPGPAPGEAAAWAITVLSSIQAFADFGAGFGPRPLESFALGWGADDFFATLLTPEPVPFDVGLVVPFPAIETFTRWTGAAPYLFALGPAAGAIFGQGLLESFALGWDADVFHSSLNPADIENAGVTTFELAGYVTALGPGDVQVAVFDGTAAAALEDFEEIVTPKSFMIDPQTGVFTSHGHNLADGTVITATSTGTLPGGLKPAVKYHLRDATPDTWKLAATPGGPAIPVADAGSGTQTAHGDPSLYWIVTLL